MLYVCLFFLKYKQVQYVVKNTAAQATKPSTMPTFHALVLAFTVVATTGLLVERRVFEDKDIIWGSVEWMVLGHGSVVWGLNDWLSASARKE